MNIFIKVGIITTIVFISGILFGLVVGGERVSELEKTIINLNNNINNAELQFLFFDVMGKNASCQYLIKEAGNLGDEAEQLGREVELFENSRKIDEKSFHQLKMRYTSVLIRDWLMLEKIKKTCEGNYITLLYFYSNKQCDKCQEQGIILSYLKEKLKDRFLVFAIDSDLELQIVKMLKDAYSVQEYPTLVINGEVYPGFMDIQEIKNITCNYNKDLEIC